MRSFWKKTNQNKTKKQTDAYVGDLFSNQQLVSCFLHNSYINPQVKRDPRSLHITYNRYLIIMLRVINSQFK
jgi:hypothetical protein